MSPPTILQVALDTPLRRLFDYSAGDEPVAVGCRVRVPFGRQTLVGMVVGLADSSALPADKLRPIRSVIDAQPLLDAEHLALLGWAAQYYHHPLGPVIAAALPRLLREGADAQQHQLCWSATAAGLEALAAGQANRAPRQRELLALLAGNGWVGQYLEPLGIQLAFNRNGVVIALIFIGLPFVVRTVQPVLEDTERELEEAAIMDGCGPLRIIFQVFMPLLWPARVSTGLLAFIGAWNEFMFALTFVVNDTERTVPVAISLIAGATAFEIPWGTIMAGSVIVTVPLLLLVFFFQKRIVSGLTAGAVKG